MGMPEADICAVEARVARQGPKGQVHRYTKAFIGVTQERHQGDI